MRYELWRRVKDDMFERWEEQTCSFNPAKPAEPVSIEAEGAATVQGMRHRLQVYHFIAARYPQVTTESQVSLSRVTVKSRSSDSRVVATPEALVNPCTTLAMILFLF